MTQSPQEVAASFDLDALKSLGQLRTQVRADELLALCNAVLAGQWQPIETAPEGKIVVVGWLDSEDVEHPECRDLDYLEDGCWAIWHDHAEHVEMIGGHGVSHTPPYTCWLDIPAIPAPPPTTTHANTEDSSAVEQSRIP